MVDEKFQLVVSITGHRPDKLGGYKIPNPTYTMVVAGLISVLDKLQPAYVITGMALGVDQWAAEVCINMGIPFVAAIPFEGQESKWPPQSQARYQWLLSKAYQKYYISEPGYAPYKMHKRNEWMMQSAHEVVAVWDGSTGGTAAAVAAAQALGKKIHYVPIPAAGMPLVSLNPKIEETLGMALLKQILPDEPPKVESSKLIVTPDTKRIIDL